MDLRSMRYFVAIAEEMNFSRAAQRLNISQSALSRHVQLLEAELQLQLFDRIGRRIALTPSGEELRAGCRTILQDVQALHTRTTGLARGIQGVLRVGVTPQTLESLVARVLAIYKERHPDIRVELLEDGAARLNVRVLAGEIHLAIGVTPEGSSLAGKKLFPIAALALLPRGHRLSGRRSLDVAELATERLLLLRPEYMTRQLFDGACKIAQILPSDVTESASPHCLAALVDAGHGVAIVPSTALLQHHSSRLVPLQQGGKPLLMPLSVTWDMRRSLSPASRQFIDLIYEATRTEFPGQSFVQAIDVAAAVTAHSPRRPATSQRRGPR